MSYLRSLFVTLTIAVQLVTLAYVLVVMGNSEAFDQNRSIVNSTDARAVYYLAAVAGVMMFAMAVLLWLERRGPTRRIRRRGAAGGDNGAPVAAGGGTHDRRDRDRSDSDGGSDSGGDGGGGGDGGR